MCIRSFFHGLITLVLVSIVAVIPFGAHAQVTPEPPQMFYAVGPAEIPEHVTLPESAMMGRSKFVRVNFGLLRSGRLSLNLLDGVAVQAVLERRITHLTGGDSWIGTLDGIEGSQAIFSQHGKALSGVVSTGDRMFKIQHVGKGVHVVSEVGTVEPRPEDLPVPVPAHDISSGQEAELPTGADGGSTGIDVLVAYTSKARTARGGTDGIISLIELAITETNQIYVNSQIDASLRLVHTHEVSYTESNSMSTDLSRLRSTSDGHMDEAHTLRDQYGADMVSLIVDRTDYCGIAYLMTSLSSGFASSAFSVVEDGCATGYYSFAHELGHNMGSQHDYETVTNGNSSWGIYDYSFGFWLYHAPTTDYVYRTVMAYNCPGGCTRMSHFSNPSVSLSHSSGDMLPTGIANEADNARSLNNALSTVATWRPAAAVEPPLPPDGLVAVTSDHETVDLSWLDHSDNESGFKIERSADGNNFTEIAITGAGISAYADTNLSADTTYYYQVRSYNGFGNSTYSNVAYATTDSAPTWVRRLAASDIPVHGSVSGSYLDTQSEDGSSQRITETHSGGKPQKRYTWLEHQWAFNLPLANSHTLNAIVSADVVSPEHFTFAYSTNGQDWVDMFMVTVPSGAFQALIPSSVSGTLYVRVADNHRVQGQQTSHWVSVDHLYIDSDSAPVDPPAAPASLSATAVSSSAIELVWGAAQGAVESYSVERSPDDLDPWQEIATVSGAFTGYIDTGLAANTPYFYRVYAVNSGGRSDPSPTASDTTDEAALTTLTATYIGNSRGRKLIELAWTGLSGEQVNIRRDGVQIKTVSNTEAYTDSVKKGGTYNYQVCEISGGACTPTVSVSF